MVTPIERPASLFSRTRAAVLSVLLLHPDQRFHLRELARLAEVGLGAIQRELAGLVSMGIIQREESGRQVYFQADTHHPIFQELQGLIAKTAGVSQLLRDALADVGPRIRLAVVFGSMASGRLHRGSDLDLLVISDELSMRDLAGAIRKTSAKLGREININLYRPQEWADRVRQGHPLVRSILTQPKLPVFGDPNELDRMAEERVAEAAQGRSGRDLPPARGDRARPARRAG